MALLPKRVQNTLLAKNGQPLSDYLTSQGWILFNQGKVRDTYFQPSDPDSMLVVASDRLSAFDFVLATEVDRKGEILTALTHFWLTQVFADIPNHLIGIPDDPGLPRERCLLVRRLVMQDYEMIFRMHIGGSVWKEYQEHGTAGGWKMPAELMRWQKLDHPLFTPSTKAKTGHDVNITAALYFEQMGDKGREAVLRLQRLYSQAYEHALKQGYVILDGKFEVGSPFMLADEICTPDSCRFTTVGDLKQAMAEGRNPVFYDKEPVREYVGAVPTPFGVTGIGSLDPENASHLAFVHDSLQIPSEVVADTTARYMKIFEGLVGVPLNQYQREFMA